MISNPYKLALAKEAKQLDSILGQDSKFEILTREITDEQSERAILELVKELSILVKRSPIPNIKERQETIVESLCKYLGSFKIDELHQNLKESSNVPLNDLLDELNELVGLADVKQQIHDLIDFNKIQKLRVENGLKRSDKTLHIAFVGNPGTGKTSVARIIGKMYKSIGLLSKGHFIEASRTDLIAEYQGQTAIKVKRLINRAKGGVLFIDEAYSITENDHSDSYGRECLTELTKALEDYRDDLVVIVAGYSEPMEQFFESNPGLKSRFTTFITFNDYSADELEEILALICRKNDYCLSEELKVRLKALIVEHVSQKSEHFANGRLVRNIYDDLIMKHARRVAQIESPTREILSTIIIEDL